MASPDHAFAFELPGVTVEGSKAQAVLLSHKHFDELPASSDESIESLGGFIE